MEPQIQQTLHCEKDFVDEENNMLPVSYRFFQITDSGV